MKSMSSENDDSQPLINKVVAFDFPETGRGNAVTEDVQRGCFAGNTTFEMFLFGVCAKIGDVDESDGKSDGGAGGNSFHTNARSVHGHVHSS